ncbi:tRNA threonylcarbamoyladenosine biosynthesis protein TsaB [compost metagenome]
MKILSVDTTSPRCSVAILEDKNLIKELTTDYLTAHSENLMPMIDQILNECDLRLSDINLLVCDKGPGSFTGIRISIATIKGFSDSLDIPTIGISSLESLAYNVPNSDLVCSIVDAKHSNIYYTLFKKGDSKFIEIEESKSSTVDEMLETISKYKEEITFVGDGAITYKDEILAKFNTSKISDIELNAYSLGIAGFTKYKETLTSENILPSYLKKPQAEIMLEEKLKCK